MDGACAPICLSRGIKMTKEEDKKEMWSMDDLISLTNEIQTSEVSFRKKGFSFQYCELTEKEEPNLEVKDDLSEAEKNAYYMEIGTGRVKCMLDKANNMNPEGATASGENWGKLPSTLRFMIANEIMGVESEVTENFTTG